MAKKAGKGRIIIALQCEETGDRNYTTKKKQGTDKLRIRKFSPRLRRHTWHIEKKVSS